MVIIAGFSLTAAHFNQAAGRIFAIHKDTISKTTIIAAASQLSKVIAQAASINIKYRVPAFDAFSINPATGCFMALESGTNINNAKATRKTPVVSNSPLAFAWYNMAPNAAAYNMAPICRSCLVCLLFLE